VAIPISVNLVADKQVKEMPCVHGLLATLAARKPYFYSFALYFVVFY
jgi:hypothetical protein